MRISKIEHIHYDDPIPVYDVVNAGDLHNFVIHTDNSDVVAHNCLMDEVNFAKAGIKDITKSKEQMKKIYDTANTRITGTFKLGGRIYGKMFTCSSKNTDNDYLSEHIEKQLDAGNTHIYLYDRPQWEVLPKERFGTEKFYITVGDRYKRGFVVAKENSDEAHLQEYRNEGYKVLEVPADYEPNFRSDYDIALRDIAGISVVGAMGFITQEMITPNVTSERQNPFFKDYYEIGVQDKQTLEQFFHTEVVPVEFRRKPMNIHIDFAEVSDHIGIAGAIQDGERTVFDPLTEKKIVMPFFRQIFQVAIGAPRGDRMSFQKVINFISWLKKSGFNIGIVSTDQYQSSYVRENLTQQGFICEKVSVDKTEDPYIGLRNLLQDQRLELIKHELQEVEMIHLQRVNGVINHPPQSACLTADTKIQLVDGRILTIAELLIEQQYKTNWVYTVNESTGLIEPKPIIDVFQTKITKELVKVTLDNDEVIYCTPDHRFMLRDGSYDQAQNLMPGDSLMPLYTKVASKGLVGYRLYYEPKTDDWHFEHRSFCLDPKLGTGVRSVVHHCNYIKLDNRPSNLKRMTTSKHMWIHSNKTIDHTKVSAALQKWHANNRDTEQYKRSKHQGIINLIIRNAFAKTGQMISVQEAEEIHNKLVLEEKRNQSRIHDIELLYQVDWQQTHGRIHNTWGARLSALVARVENKYSVVWDTLSDDEKVSYANKWNAVQRTARWRTFERILCQEITWALNRLLDKPCRIKTMSLFTSNDLKTSWIEYLFGVDWSMLSAAEKCLATRRFNRILELHEFIPLDEHIEYVPKVGRIYKTISLFGTEQDIRLKNIEEYCGVHLDDISVKQRSGYGRIYSNFCKGLVTKDALLQCRIVAMEQLYGIVWKELDVAGRSKYSLMYHNLTHPEEKQAHYNATTRAISRHAWYTNGVDNKYLKSTDPIPDGYYKGRVRSRASVEKGIATVLNRSPEEKAKYSKIYGADTSRRIWVTNGVEDRYIYKDAEIPEGFVLGRCKVGKNHKVKSVEYISMPCRVYDLTIKDNHNFALAAGVFVHNSITALPSIDNGYNSKGIGKDCADALCGCMATLVAHADVVKPPMKHVINAIASVNGPRSYGLGGKPNYIPGFGQQYRKL